MHVLQNEIAETPHMGPAANMLCPLPICPAYMMAFGWPRVA